MLQRVHSKLGWLVVALLLAGTGAPVLADGKPAESISEDQARAGFLYQIAQYVQWPGAAFPLDGSPLRFCIMGQDSVAANLEAAVRGKSIQGHALVVMRAREITHLQGCQVAYIGPVRERALRDLFDTWMYPPVLLVGESSRFTEMGGMVNLAFTEGRVSFEINTAAAERAGLVFRSQLLRFARLVTDHRGSR